MAIARRLKVLFTARLYLSLPTLPKPRILEGGLAMSRFLSRFSVKRQIGLIAAIGVFGLIALGASYLFSNWQLARMQARIDSARTADNLLTEMENGLFEAKQIEKDFLLRHTDANIALHAARIEDVSAKADLLALSLDDSALNAKAEALGPALRSYGERFAKLGATQRTLGLDESGGLLGAMRKSATDVERQLDAHNDLRLQNLLLARLRIEKNFLLPHDAKAADDMKQAYTDFVELLPIAKISPAMRESVVNKMEAYQRDFAAMVEGAMTVQSDIAALDKSYADIQATLPVIVTSIRGADQAANTAMQALQRQAAAVMYGTILVVTLIVAGVGFVVGRGGSGPLPGPTDAVTQLARGDKTRAIPGRRP